MMLCLLLRIDHSARGGVGALTRAGSLIAIQTEKRGTRMVPVVRPFVALVVLGSIVLSGCSSKPSEQQTTGAAPNQLQEVGNMLRDFCATTNRGPANVGELASLETGYHFGYAALKAGDIEVIWGAMMAGEGGGGSDSIIAYETKVPSEGGYVLLENGTVKKMTAAEFQAAPKAGKR
jgi:hypothetical protein